MVYTVRWGILEFAGDLLKDPSTRNTTDVAHVVAAVASSSGKDRAQRFCRDLRIPEACAAYGSYGDLINDANVDIVYVASPHSHHFQHAMLALEGGKHVVCEKPLTVNAAQAKVLYKTAKEKNLFLLDAVWTRFFPLSIQVRESIQKGEIGEVLRVMADTSFGIHPDISLKETPRKLTYELAGGALLEIGIYSLTWVFQTLYHTLPRDQRKPPSSILSYMNKYEPTSVDQTTTVLLSFPTSTPSNLPNSSSHGIAMTAFAVATDPDHKNSAGPAIRIQGTRGEIQVYGPAFQPTRYRVIPAKQGGLAITIRDVELTFPANGHGMFYEADEAARCIRDGKLESETMPWDESILVMEVMDEVRKQGGLRYPDSIESDVIYHSNK
ncbi:Trans-1,2-dihydrobenzene-1,2-diol dehydrogenase [Fonsecaea pedrosoi]|nr:Trans-1,2-dihydrobenzene-1,2-diol dehydrogenase [Fonsecaea pedrosoi]